MANKLLLVSFVLSFFFFFMIHSSNADHNVIRYGAKPDGKTDATQAFLRAWKSACSSATASTIYVPKGRYLIKGVEFRGPCKSRIKVQIDGTILAPLDYHAIGNSGYWILFIQVNRISVFGGTLDAKGAGFWACRRAGKNCPVGARVSY